LPSPRSDVCLHTRHYDERSRCERRETHCSADVASGFLEGLGAIIALCIALGIAVLIARHWYIEPESDFSAKDIVLSCVEEQKRDGLTWIIGTAKNSGKRPTRSIEVQANLFEHGMFVDQYSGTSKKCVPFLANGRVI
jgi:hypothetical protein